MLDEQELVGAWDQGLTCLALRALTAAVAHSDDAGRPVVLLALCVGKGLRRVRLLLLAPEEVAAAAGRGHAAAAACQLLRAVFVELHRHRFGADCPLAGAWAAEDAAEAPGSGGPVAVAAGGEEAAESWARVWRHVRQAEVLGPRG